jgi:HPt (histidine-containing phosphotransfer) domain-containing protein
MWLLVVIGIHAALPQSPVEDFIAQANDFKDKLYTAYDLGENDKVKSLSHKLKGVAANLRIEDAFEVLSIINTSNDADEIKKNLNIFYKIVAKLSGEEQTPKTQENKTSTNETQSIDLDNDTIDLGMDELEIDDQFDNSIVKNEKISFDDDLSKSTDEIKLDDTIDFEDDSSESTDEIKLDDTIDFEDKIEFQNDELDILDDEDFVLKDETTHNIKNDSPNYIYDKKSAAKELGVDTDSFNELFDDFIAESKLTIEKISNAIEQNDQNLWKKYTLRLKGMSSNMRLNKLDSDLDTLSKSDDATVAKEALSNIETSLEEILTI